jgi:GR25 family glycosyltransferase involved in LPS biosynthesis
MVASFKEDNDAYEEEDEKVVEEELGMVLQRFEAVNAKVDGIGSYQ